MANFKNSFKMLYYFFKPYKKLLSVYLMSLILFSALDVFRVALIYPIINYGLDVNVNQSIFDTLFQFVLPGNINPFVASGIFLAVITIIMAFFEIIVAYLGSITYSKVRDTTDRSVFNTIKNQPYEYFAKHKQGDLLYIGQVAVDQTGTAVRYFIAFLQNLFLCLFYLSFIFILSFEISIIVLILGIIFVFFVKNTIFVRIYKHGSILNTAAKTKSVVYNEFISGIKSIFITDSVDFWTVKYEVAVKKLLNSYTRVQVLQRIPSIINNFILFMIIGLGAIGLYFYTDGNFLQYIGIFGTFLLALYRMIPALNGCQTQYGAIMQQLPAIEAVYSVLKDETNEYERNIDKKNIPKKVFQFQKLITFKNVTFKYSGGLDKTIKNLSFDIRKNTRVAIVGNSGAGKTTIANLLALLYKPTSGDILIDGTNLNEFNHSDYLKTLGYLGQETFVYHDTIKENIRFGLDCNDDDIIVAAKLADAHDFILATTDGYDTIIGDQGIKLSGGQRQRIAIARIMLRKPEILLLDEATSALDNRSEQRVMEAVDRISKNMTVITIAHRLSTVQNADVIYVMKDGQICESGSHEELIKTHGEYYNLYTKQGNANEK
ncbi:ABC transporter ATP-binding protein/permease [Methanogenium sp. S4BF]|uniref:ABC transporter ATP-binding protein n=1 Tax=Methanogenium sp. S4BF TaxID=1789226 RepID=UPI0024160B3E|nr:ABC transporter ATP-binding protein [Methanogenium sp. S4BF]WFN35002.1 ABC transporter ATP-binding protein/permease [Methanogenium sp. S4BF]